MNYIASFIFHVTNNEEESFYILLGLFTHTEYKLMFLNELFRLKQFFYIFDRLLILNIPELYNYFKINNILCSFFCSPWFITMFTNSYQFDTNECPPKIIIKIWDDFILNGWEALLRAALILLKIKEEELLLMKHEELLHYIINNLIKECFYDNKNYEMFMVNFNNTKFKPGLLSNIENESAQEKRVKEIDVSNNMTNQHVI